MESDRVQRIAREALDETRILSSGLALAYERIATEFLDARYAGGHAPGVRAFLTGTVHAHALSGRVPHQDRDRADIRDEVMGYVCDLFDWWASALAWLREHHEELTPEGRDSLPLADLEAASREMSAEAARLRSTFAATRMLALKDGWWQHLHETVLIAYIAVLGAETTEAFMADLNDASVHLSAFAEREYMLIKAMEGGNGTVH